MGMMILRHFDNDPEEDNSDESETEDRARYPPNRAREEEPEEMENEEKGSDLVQEQTDDENIAEKDEKSEVEPNGLKGKSDANETEAALVKDDERTENGLKNRRQANQDEAKMAVDIDDDTSKANTGTDIDVKLEKSKSSELEDIAMAGETSCDKDKSGGSKSEDSESDYGSADELPEADDKTDTRSARANAGFDIERILALNIQRVREKINSELGALAPQDTGEEAEVNPPEAPSFETDEDDDDEDMQVDFLEGLKRRARNSCPPRKLRYSSNTSVDTSTTSGIGSFTEDHLDMEMASHIDSQKTSPGTFSMDGPEMGKPCSKQQFMDCSDNEEEDDSDEKEGESLPKETLGRLLRENVELLPLPTALRSYVMYYRN